MYHLIQTAEEVRKKYPDQDWLHLVGFIHDLGKILCHPKLFNLPQWSVVGDTFPLGCKFDSKIVYPEFFENNVDLFISEQIKKTSKEKVRSKFDWMLNRITSKQAKDLARPFFEEAINKLEKVNL